jgi:DnaJ-class molecular chaperone
MKVLCPTCHGKGTIPDPKCSGMAMSYCGPNGEGVPQVICQSCGGTGWVEAEH